MMNLFKVNTLVYIFFIFGFIFDTNILVGQNTRIEDCIVQYHADLEMFEAKYPIKYSTDFIDVKRKLIITWQKKLDAINYNKLDSDGRLDYLLFKRKLQKDFGALTEMSQDLSFSDQYLMHNKMIRLFEESRRVGEQLDPLKWHLSFTQMDKNIDKSIRNIRDAIFSEHKIDVRQINILQDVTQELYAAFRYSYQFYDGYDPAFTRECRPLYITVDSSLHRLVDTLSSWRHSKRFVTDASGIIGTPIGAEALKADLSSELIPYSPETLIAMAEQEMAWCLKEAQNCAASMGIKGDWKQALERLKQDYVPRGEQPQFVRKISDDAINFILANQLMTIPQEAIDGWYMRMLTPKEQQYAPFFLGGDQIYIAYPHDDMNEGQQLMTLRGNNKHFTRAVVFHELIPGHNLQHFFRQRFFTYRSPFSSSFWGEGWAVYWEMMMYQKGFAQTPEDKLGMLFWRMHRCARIIFSIKFHTGQWTPQQCIDFLVNQIGHESANAEAEVRRSFTGGYGPLYQIGYMVGAMQFRALRAEWVDSGKMTERDFHDKIIKAGSMPVYMVRMMLNGSKGNESLEEAWRF